MKTFHPIMIHINNPASTIENLKKKRGTYQINQNIISLKRLKSIKAYCKIVGQ